MGSFNYICGLSGMPIVPGEDVRVMLLTENPYTKGAAPTCYTYDRYFPRTLPIKAVYDDYGSVRRRDDKTLKRNDWKGLDGDLWRKGFDIDLIVKGVGTNEYHDVAVKKGQDIFHYLSAAQEGRLFVKRDIGIIGLDGDSYNEYVAKARKEAKTPPGIPTMENIGSAIKSMDLFRQDGKTRIGFHIDSEMWGEVRVRLQDSYSIPHPEEVLGKIQKALPQYAGMVSAGQLNGGPELLLRPKPNTTDFHGLHTPLSEEPLSVGYAMFREDVWRATVSMIDGVEHWDKNYERVNYTPEYYIEAMEKAFKIHRGLLSGKNKRDGFMAKMSLERSLRHSPAEWIIKDPVVSCLGIGTNWQIFVENADNYGEAEQKAIIQDFAEYGCVAAVNSHLHNNWRISPTGSQTVDIKDWAKYFEAMAKVAADAATEWKKRYGTDE